MASDDLESAQHAVSELLYNAILLVWSSVMACDTDWREVNRNLVEAVVSDCALCIVASCVLCLFLHFYLSP